MQRTYLSSNPLCSLQFIAPILFALGTLNAFTAYQSHNHGALATGLCLCVCATGLLAEDFPQRDYRRDRAVLAYVAARPGVGARRIARAVDAHERVVARSLARLTEDGRLVLNADGPTP